MGTREDVKVDVVVNLERRSFWQFELLLPRELSMIIGVYIDPMTGVIIVSAL